MRFRCVILPNLSIGIGASSVEIAQINVTYTVSLFVPIQRFFDEKF